MGIHVQPVDGLINRLLQQNNRAPSVAERPVNASTAKRNDQVNISSAALTQRQALEDQVEQQQQKPNERALESQLLKLYKSNDLSRG